MKIVYSISLILVLLTSRGKSNGDLGQILCTYFGDVQGICKESIVPPKDLPKECTSFMWDGLAFMTDTYEFDEASLGLIAAVDKPIIILLRQYTFGKFFDYSTKKILDEAIMNANILKTYLSNSTKIKGILIDDIDLTMFEDLKRFGDNFGKYMTYMKKEYPNLLIGVGFDAGQIIDVFGSGSGGLEVSAFDSQTDFYVLRFDFFNPCKPDLVKGGVVPLNGDSPHTLDKLKLALGNNFKLPKEKLYFKYEFYAFDTKTTAISLEQQCSSSYNKMCKSPDQSKDWCSDTSTTLAEKGAFAKENGFGFSMDSIDLDDVTSACKCAKKFPAFYYILDGFNGQKPAPCPIFDKSG